MPEEPRRIPFLVTGAEEVPIIFSNFMLVQHENNEFILTFGQYSPPLTVGTPADQIEQMKKVSHIPVKTVSRIGMTPDRMVAVIEALQANYEKWKAKQEGAAQ